MPSELRTIRPGRILVIAPHMDDEVIPGGGSILLHRQAGSEIHVSFLSDSAGPPCDPDVRRAAAAVRESEMTAARERIGYQSWECFGFPDSRLVAYERRMTDRLRDTIAGFRPEQIFCPFPADSHGDHQAAALSVDSAVRETSWTGDILAYEVWSTIWPNIAVDISTVIDEKEAAIRCYASQIGDRDYAAATLGLNRYRGMRHRIGYAEAFYLCRPAEFRLLTEQLNRV